MDELKLKRLVHVFIVILVEFEGKIVLRVHTATAAVCETNQNAHNASLDSTANDLG